MLWCISNSWSCQHDLNFSYIGKTRSCGSFTCLMEAPAETLIIIDLNPKFSSYLNRFCHFFKNQFRVSNWKTLEKVCYNIFVLKFCYCSFNFPHLGNSWVFPGLICCLSYFMLLKLVCMLLIKCSKIAIACGESYKLIRERYCLGLSDRISLLCFWDPSSFIGNSFFNYIYKYIFSDLYVFYIYGAFIMFLFLWNWV